MGLQVDFDFLSVLLHQLFFNFAEGQLPPQPGPLRLALDTARVRRHEALKPIDHQLFEFKFEGILRR